LRQTCQEEPSPPEEEKEGEACSYHCCTEPAQEVMPRALRQRLETKGAKKKASNSELESELKRVYTELDLSRSTIEEKDRIIASLSTKIKTLIKTKSHPLLML
jgi:DNA polymerase sigma